MKWQSVKRKTAGFLAAVMVLSNVIGELPALASFISDGRAVTAGSPRASSSVPEKDDKEERPDTDRESDTDSEEETVTLEGEVTLLKNADYPIDGDKVELRVYRDGSYYKKARVLIEKPAEGSEAEPKTAKATDSDAAEAAASASDAAKAPASPSEAEETVWSYTVKNLPAENEEGEPYEYTIRVMTVNRDFAVLYRGQDGDWRVWDGKDKKKEISDFLCVPYAGLAGTYRTVGADGEQLSELSEGITAGWEEEPLTLTPVITGGVYQEQWLKQITGKLMLNEAKTEGTWRLDKVLAFDPETFMPYTVSAVLENCGEDFTLRYLNDDPFGAETEAAYDGAVIENCYKADFVYGARLDISWDDSSRAARPEDISFLRVYDESGSDVTDSAMLRGTADEENETAVFLEGLQEDHTYTVKAGHVAHYRAQRDEITITAVPVREYEDMDSLSAGKTLIYKQVKDVTGTIRWEDEGDKYGMRPDKEILTGLIAGGHKVEEADDITAYMTGDDSHEETSVRVSQDSDAWMFAVTNLDWDETVTLPELVGYQVEKQAARSRSAVGDEVLEYRATPQTWKVTIKADPTLIYGKLSDSEKNFAYEVKINGVLYTGTYEIETKSYTSDQGIISIPIGGSAVLTVAANSQLDVTAQPKTGYTISGKNPYTEAAISGDKSVSWTYAKKLPYYYLIKNWNDNANEHGKRITEDKFLGKLHLEYSVGGGEWKKITAANVANFNLTMADLTFEKNAALSSTANWMYSIADKLPQYAFGNICPSGDYGKEITYRVTEDAIDHYFGVGDLADPADNSTWLLINTHKYEFKAQKIWKDGKNAKGTRPTETAIRNSLVLHRKMADTDTASGEKEEILWDFSKTDTANQSPYKNQSSNRWDYVPELTITPNGDTWAISITNLPEFDDREGKGYPYTYYLEERAVPVADNELASEGVTYEPKYTNVGNHSSITDGLYQDGELANTLVGKTKMEFTKRWADADRDLAERPDKGTFELMRYPNIVEPAGTDEVNWKTASAVPGYVTIPLDTAEEEKHYSIFGQPAGGTGGSTPTQDLSLERFDENGVEYVYFVKERLSGTNAGNYEQLIEQSNDSEWAAETGQEDVIFNGGTIKNKLTKKIDKTVTKKWEAKAYQELQAEVVVNLTRQYKDPTSPDMNNPTWIKDTEFNNSADAQKVIRGFIAENMTISESFKDLELYDENGRKYQYAVKETRVIDKSQTPEKEITVDYGTDGTNHKGTFAMGGHHFEVEATNSTGEGFEQDDAIITNRLVDKTDLKIRKKWSPKLEPQKIKELEKSNTPLTVTFTVKRNNEKIGGITFVYSVAADDKIIVTAYDETDTVKQTPIGTAVDSGTPGAEPGTTVHDIIVKTLTYVSGDEKGTIAELWKYSSGGAEYLYEVEEQSVTEGGLGYSHRYSYTVEDRTDPKEVELYGQKRRIMVTDNYIGEDGEYIYVKKNWLDDYDVGHRGISKVALQIYKDNKWQFVSKTPTAAGAYTDVAAGPGEYYWLGLSEDNNREGWFTISKKDIALADKENYYAQYRVLEIETGVGAAGYAYTQAKATKDLLLPANLLAYYANGLKEDYNTDKNNITPEGIMKATNHFYKTTSKVTSAAGKPRSSYEITNLRIGMLDVDITKKWVDAFVVTHPSITVELSRALQDEGNYNDDTVNKKDLGLSKDLSASKENFPRELRIETFVDDNKPSGSFLNLPKYDQQGRLYDYALAETAVGDVPVAGSSVKVSVETHEKNENGNNKKQEVTYNISESYTYTVGEHQHTSDKKAYEITNKLAESVGDYTVHKVWKDDRTTEAQKKRPDIYLTLYRSTYTYANGQPTEVREAVPGYVDRVWKTVDSPQDPLEYHWTCTFDSLPQYDATGNKYYYTAQEVMRTPGDYIALYFKEGARNPITQDIADITTANVKLLNGGKTEAEFNTVQGLFQYAPNDGTIVNVPRDTLFIEGKKYFQNMVNAMKIEDYPTITLQLRRRLKNDGNSVFENVKNGADNVTFELDIKQQGTITPVYDFGKPGSGAPSHGTLPKYDENGREYEYAVSETQINGVDIKKGEIFDWVEDATNFTITNRYIEKLELAYEVKKIWSSSPASATHPSVTIHLNRAMTDDAENVLLYTVQENCAPEQVITNGSNLSVTFASMAKLGPNGYPWYYWISEDKANGYSGSGNQVNAAIKKAIKAGAETIDKRTLDALETIVASTAEEITNTYPSADAGDYVTISGKKVWKNDNNNLFDTRWARDKVKMELYRSTTNDQTTGEKVTDATFAWNNASTSPSDSNYWEFSFTGIDNASSGTGFFKYAPDGKPYYYFIKELVDVSSSTSPDWVEVGSGNRDWLYEYNSQAKKGTDGKDTVEPISIEVTNTQKYVDLKVEKKWVDDNHDMYNTRPTPENLKIYVKRESTNLPGETVVGKDKNPIYLTVKKGTTTADNWSAELKGLPKYYSHNGIAEEITYTVVEDMDLSKTQSGEKLGAVYESKIDPSTTASNVQTTVITNTRKVQEVGSYQFTATKTWTDNQNADNLRPEALRFKLYKKTGDTGDWTALDNSVIDVVSGKTEDKEAGTAGISYDAAAASGPWQVTWHNLPNATKASPSEPIYYMAVETDYAYAKTDQAADWDWKAIDAPVTGTAPGATGAVGPYYGVEYAAEDPAKSNIKPEAEGNTTSSQAYNITNSHTQIKLTATVEKKWENDQDNAWNTRKEVTMGLFYATAKPVIDNGKVTYAQSTWTPYQVGGQRQTVTLAAAAGNPDQHWKGSIPNLPYAKDTGELYQYTFFEIDDQGAVKPIPSYSAFTTLQRGSAENMADWGTGQIDKASPSNATVPVVVTNALNTTKLTVTKDWKDEDDRYGLRPDRIAVRLEQSTDGTTWETAMKKNAQGVLEEVKGELTTAGWTYEFKALPVADSSGKSYLYRAVEIRDTAHPTSPAGVPAYEASEGIPSKNADGTFRQTITNSLISDGSIKVAKKWDDKDNQDGLRPKSITVYLLDLDSTEQAVIQAKIQEIDSIANSPYKQTIEPDAAGVWEFTWKNLPKYRNALTGTQKAACKYYIYEQRANQYDAPAYKLSAADTFNRTPVSSQVKPGAPDSAAVVIQNTRTPIPLSIRATKEWKNGSGGTPAIQPAQVDVVLQRRIKGHTEDADSAWASVTGAASDAGYVKGLPAGFRAEQTLSKDTVPAFEFTWQDLPAYEYAGGDSGFNAPAAGDAAKQIEYRVRERAVTGFTPTYSKDSVTGDDADRAQEIVITNTLAQKSLTVTKKWVADPRFPDCGKDDVFEFLVQYKTAEENIWRNYKGTYQLTAASGAASQEQSTADGKIRLKAGDTLQIAYPAGYQYQVKETKTAYDTPYPHSYTAVITTDGLHTPEATGTMSADKTIVFTNTAQVDTGKLAVKKTLSGDDTDPEKNFPFTIQLTYPDGTRRTETRDLKGGDIWTLKDLPAKTAYVVTEEYEDYVQTITGNDSGTIVKNGTAAVTFDNEKHKKVGTLILKKTVSGSARYQNESFEFQVKLTDAQGAVTTYTPSLKKDEQAVFHRLPLNTRYEITETTPAGYQMTVTEGSLTGEIVTDGQTIQVTVNNKKNSSGGNGGGGGGGGGSKKPPAAVITIPPGIVPHAPGYVPPRPQINRLPATGQITPDKGYTVTKAPAVTADTEINPAYRDLYQQNRDMAGWIQLPGTALNYPVMLTTQDPEYYLHRNFQKQYDFAGLPIIGQSCDSDSMNMLISGHNMKDGSQFTPILNYADAAYFRKHPTIIYNTLTREGEYEIIGAFYSQVYPAEAENVFKFYQWSGDMNEAQFDYYVENVKKSSLYETGKTAKYGDQLITLSTCAYHVPDGRFVVVARKADVLKDKAEQVRKATAAVPGPATVMK